MIIRILNKTGEAEGRRLALQTRECRDIENCQGATISLMEQKDCERIEKEFSNVTFRTRPLGVYNCHGMTFACRRTRVWHSPEVWKIIADDNYEEIKNRSNVLPGDIILYLGVDVVEHSGIVISKPTAPFWIPDVVSKWGSFGEVIHPANNCPYAKYEQRYYRVFE